jgi:arylsulfatase
MQHDNENFQGVIGRTYRESRPHWPAPAAAPGGAPNVVFIVLDDVGFSDIGCYGSEIRTPRMDQLAAGGLRYSNFHVTAMCSPTRACLLTGRNAHAAGVGAIAEWSNGFPGYQGRMSRKTATAAEIFADHGYGTYAIGKWHLSSLDHYGVAGPHPHWPLGRGFARWYGFLGGYVDHWNPDLHEDNHPIRLDPKPEGYHLSEDLVDHAIGQIRDHLTSAKGRPFFTYLAFGAAHWPHHVPEDYIRRYAGRYDCGWDAIREERLARQKALGLVPQDTQLAPRNPGIEAWDQLPEGDRRVRARLQETYAAFMEHTDEQIGRVIDELARLGQLNNTAIVLLSDNGASGEGGQTGAVSIRKHMLTEKEDTAYGLEHLDTIGSAHSFPHYPMGWAQVSNTPLKWFKKNTHGGGIRAPLIVHWPDRIRARGEIRHQYHHVIDVLPTLLDAGGMQAPRSYRGVEQLPMHGISMTYTFDPVDGPDAPTRKTVQHFEIVGDRAIWHEGWKAVARHAKGDDFETDRWELYHLEEDFAEVHDLAAERPEHLKQLIALWWVEAEKYGVLPLDDRETERAFDWFRNNTPSRYDYLPGNSRADRLMVPAINERSWRLDAHLHVGDAATARGVVLACGNRFAGFTLYCDAGDVVFEYVYTEQTSYVLRARLPAGVHTVTVGLARRGAGGRFVLMLDGLEQAAVDVPKLWTTYGVTAGVTCGYANVPVSRDWTPPFECAPGLVERVSVEIEGAPARPVGAFAALMQEE